MEKLPVEKRPAQWYGCAVCGELRRYPFETYADLPGCRCLPANGVQNGSSVEPERREQRDRPAVAPLR